MVKVQSWVAICCVFVFTSANAPTSIAWLDLPPASLADELDPKMIGGSAGSPTSEMSVSTQPRELDESHRFQVDELHLPTLNVDLPDVFHWLRGRQPYFADTATFGESAAPALLRSQHSDSCPSDYLTASSQPAEMWPTSMSPGRLHGFNGRGGEHPRRSSPASKANDSEDAQSDSDQDDIDRLAVSSEDSNDETAANSPGDGPGSPEDEPELIAEVVDTSNDSQHRDTPSAEAPTAVPLPGTFILFALGLTGLHVTSRWKKRS